MTKVLDWGVGSVSYHTSCQRSSKRVHRGVRLHLEVSKQKWDSTWRLTYCRHSAVSSNGRSDRRNFPLWWQVFVFLADAFRLLQKNITGHRWDGRLWQFRKMYLFRGKDNWSSDRVRHDKQPTFKKKSETGALINRRVILYLSVKVYRIRLRIPFTSVNCLSLIE